MLFTLNNSSKSLQKLQGKYKNTNFNKGSLSKPIFANKSGIIPNA